jgi:hypothetical protein
LAAEGPCAEVTYPGVFVGERFNQQLNGARIVQIGQCSGRRSPHIDCFFLNSAGKHIENALVLEVRQVLNRRRSHTFMGITAQINQLVRCLRIPEVAGNLHR